MARKPCRKRVFATRVEALAMLRQLDPLSTRRREVRAYRCGRHNRAAWHLTSRPARKR